MSKEIVLAEDLKPVLDTLSQEDAKDILSLRNELAENWKKKQIFRTETEMRISVLNDAKHPTNASKYWQSVREMSAMFDALIGASFDLRKNDVKRERIEIDMRTAEEDGDDLTLKDLQIDLDMCLWERANLNSTVSDRVRELKLWSEIKTELDDGTFDNTDVNTHQAVSYAQILTNRVKTLGENPGPGEYINAAGPLQTVQRLMTQNGSLKTFDGKEKIKLGHQQSDLLEEKK